MPLVSVTLSAEPSPELTRRAVAALTELTIEVLGKERGRTTVVVQFVPARQWSRGGELPAHGFLVEVKITTGTNSRQDKARYVREVNRSLQALLGDVAGYVVVNEIPSDSWGYGGETQEVRYVRDELVA